MQLRRSLPSSALTLLAGAFLACSHSAHHREKPVQEIPHLARLRELVEHLPRRARFVEAGDAGGSPLRVHLRETGRDTGQSLLLAVHGFMMDGSDWDAVAADLGRDHEIVAVDLPGAGCSDAPPPCALGPESYSADELARRAWWVVRRLLSEGRGRHEIVLVGESLGAVVALRMLGSPAVLSEAEAERPFVIGAVL